MSFRPVPRRYHPADSLVGPRDARYSDVAVNRAGEVAALDFQGALVHIFDDHEMTESFSAVPKTTWPSGLAYNKVGQLFVSGVPRESNQNVSPWRARPLESDNYYPEVSVLNSGCYHDTQRKTFKSGSLESDTKPTSISVTSDYNVVVCYNSEKYGAGCVWAKSPEGKSPLFIARDSKLGSEIGCAIFCDGKYFISAVHLHMIKVFGSRGKYLYSFGEHGRRPGEFYRPLGLAAGADNVLFICDSENKRIQVTTLKGDLITSIAMSSPPIRIATSRDGDLFVADRTNEIQVFKPDHNA